MSALRAIAYPILRICFLGSIRHNFDSGKTTLDDIADKTKFTQAKQKSEACFYTFFKHFEALDH